MKTKLSFKKEPKKTGLSSIGYPHQNIIIKVDKKYTGRIVAPNWQTDDMWRVGFAIKKENPDNNPNCDWKWIYFKNEFANEEEAREYVKKRIDVFVSKHTLHFFEEIKD